METMVKFNKHILVFVTALSAITMVAREKQGVVKRTTNSQRVMAGCSAPQASAELTVNNVRTIIFSGSDMWWDLFGSTDAWYAVPKVNDKSKFVNSNFAGNVWFGGIDGGNNLRLAAQTYRQDGIDFWTGPLSTVDATTSPDICAKYDKIFKMTRKEVDEFVGSGTISQAIRDWPGNGDLSLNQDQLLAPFKDVDNDNIYNPEAGDYPYYDVFNNEGKDNAGVCKARLFGDETLWWVYNDNADVHQATGGKPIGMEIRAQAFAFKTTDDINNMTFYNYQLINRASTPLYQTYMTVWTDADLGCYQDDYIGCDVQRGLGFIYNADGFDENCGSNGYGEFIPALGCDFFQGPLADLNNGIDDDHDGTIDELGEQMGMTKFVYYNNNIGAFLPPMINPDNAQQYYNYMTGRWKDGTPFTCDAANAYGGSVPTDFVFPWTTYTNSPCGPANWEETATPLDRRFLQSSGPFTLLPGAVNYVTVGLPWARTSSSGAPKESVKLLKVADDKAQALFDNCFKVLSGPEAPDMTIQELSNELIIYFSNKPSSNNYLNNYKELDPSIIVDTTHYKPVDKYYHFEGFKVYQLKNESVTQEELTDASKAKLVFQCDVNNGIKRLVNYEYDANVGGDVAKVKVEGKDNGIQSTFHFTQDEFSISSDKKVINNKTYYFYCVAYGYNQYGEYKEDTPWSALNFPSSEGQKRPYLEGRKSKKAYGIPHIADPEKEGTISNSFYGYGPKITRIEGQGNGGNNLALTQNSINDILNSNGRVPTITYENGRGPINVKVVDPLNVPNSNFSFKFINRNWSSNQDTVESDPCRSSAYHKQFPYPKLKLSNTTQAKILADSATWVLTDLTRNKEYYPCKSIKIGEEFYFSDLGLSVNIGQVRDVADYTSRAVETGDYISGTMTFANTTQLWLGGLPDRDGAGALNWIRAGNGGGTDPAWNDHEINTTDGFSDPKAVFEGVLGGTWAPYVLTAAAKTGTNPVLAAPGFSTSSTISGDKLVLGVNYDLRALASVQVVITPDKSKWTKALVLEECDDVASSESGYGRKLEPRRRLSVDKQGVPLGAPGCNTAEATLDSVPGMPYLSGLGWFPGYAINLETGERLNIAFGEDSYQSDANLLNPNHGADMMWNPTSTAYQNNYYAFGGRHYIYVFGNNRSTTTYTNIPAPFTTVNGRHVGVGNYNTTALTDMVQQYKLAATYLASSSVVERTRASGIMNNIWSEAMWVNIPLLLDDRYAFVNPANIPCDVTVDLKVRKPYRYGLSGSYNGTVTGLSAVANQLMFSATTTTANITRDTVTTAANNNFGYYTFNTSDIFTEVNSGDRAKSALDLINVVPNPYYAYSTYEQNRVDNRVRITNLPNKCKIKIFTLNGTLVRTFDRDVSGQEDVVLQTKSEFTYAKRTPYQDWDLKNQNGITVASGLYIIHIDVPGVGEKILKWFGVMRPLDLQSY